MRFSRLLLSCSVVGSLLVVPMAAPAGAVENCATTYIRWVADNAPSPTPGSVLDAVDVDVVLAYWTATFNYVNCQTDEADEVPDQLLGCIEATPGYQNLWASGPLLRYADVGVNLLGGHFSVYPFNMTADAQAIVACAL